MPQLDQETGGRHQGAQAHAPQNDLAAPHVQRQRQPHGQKKRQQGQAQRLGVRHPHVRPVKVAGRTEKRFLLRPLPTEGLDHPDSRKAFLPGHRQAGGVRLHPFLHRPQPAAHGGRHRQNHREPGHRQNRQPPVEPGQRRHRPHASEYEAQDHRQTEVEEVAHRFHVCRRARHQITRLRPVVVGEAQPLQLVIQQVAQP